MPAISLNPLREALLAKGLPADYVRRTLGELADHLTESDSVDAGRLGEPRRLAKQFAREYRQSTFAGRHPWLSSLLLAFVLMHLLVIGYYLVISLIFLGFARVVGITDDGDGPADRLETGLDIAFTLGAIIPFVLVARLAARQVRRMGRGRWWAVGLFAVVTLLSGLCATNMQFAPSPGGHGTLMIGYGVGAVAEWKPLVQALVVAVCGWLFCRHMFDGRVIREASAEG